ncbi:MAG: GNAT family N-acetyltransferase [Acidimicrobiia bacterium]|nr:GNAT family N-acetyltransferase [Acidimicrobiia bacterium]
MEIIDLTEQHRELFCLCLEDWSEEAREAGPRRSGWLDRMEPLGLRAKLAVDDAGEVGGMIQYLPIEHSFVLGEDLWVIPCIWVHSYDEGRGDFSGNGMGTALLEAAEQDARARGAKGMVAWGLGVPVWMKASWFRKHGYEVADRQNVRTLVWKPFDDDAVAPRWIPEKEPPFDRHPGKVNITAYSHGWCMAGNLVLERARRVADEFGDAVVFDEVRLPDRRAMVEHGQIDAVFLNGKDVSGGAPVSLEKLRRTVARQVRRL